MMFSNVGGFVCYIINIIALLYSIIFYPDITESPVSAALYLMVLGGNTCGLIFAASAGTIVNHMVCMLAIIVVLLNQIN